MSNTESGQSTDRRAGKYLTFELADEAYGIEIIKVREIIGMMAITHVPRMPEYDLGVTNLRGKVIPVVDLRLKFCMEFAEQTSETCIIVVDVDGNQLGLKVDKVSEVLNIPGVDIEDPPIVDASVDSAFIMGMGKAKDRVNILLDITYVVNGPGKIDVNAITESAAEV